MKSHGNESQRLKGLELLKSSVLVCVVALNYGLCVTNGYLWTINGPQVNDRIEKFTIVLLKHADDILCSIPFESSSFAKIGTIRSETNKSTKEKRKLSRSVMKCGDLNEVK